MTSNAENNLAQSQPIHEFPLDGIQQLALSLVSKTPNGLTELTGLAKAFLETAEAIQNGIQRVVQSEEFKGFLESIPAFLVALQTYPERSRKAAQKAAERGWFVGPTLGASILAGIEAAEDGEALDRIFAAQYSQDLKTIEECLLLSFPARARFLQEGFQAYRDQRYASSVLLFLSQADGIFRDQFGEDEELFSSLQQYAKVRCQKNPGGLKKEEAGRLRSGYTEPLHSPLSSSAPIRLWRNNPDSLNRHAIFHGADLAYDTEIHSLKAISLVSLLEWVRTGNAPDPIGKNGMAQSHNQDGNSIPAKVPPGKALP